MAVVNHSKFDASSRAVLAFLHQRVEFDLWMMTKTNGRDWTVLQAEDHGYNVKEGTVFRWTDSFCSRMVEGRGPRVAPRAQDIPVYSTAPIGQQVSIGAYIGVPVLNADGSLFGTMCAIDPIPQRESIRDELPVVELCAELLGTVIDTESSSVELARLLEISRREALIDTLTGVLNRNGWEASVVMEETQLKRYGAEASVFVIDLDNLKQTNDENGHVQGDALIRSTADCLQGVLRKNDIVARIGGDEFAVMAIDCNEKDSEALLTRIRKALSHHGVEASVGKSTRTAEGGLISAIDQADRNMYAAKVLRKKH